MTAQQPILPETTSPLNIVVGITGGIAAYKAVNLIREFVKMGHDVHVIATKNALRFVGAPTLEAISRNPLNTSIFDEVDEVRHVSLGQQADLIVVAPATANTLAKIAAGISDDLLGNTILASHAPVVLAPAMHTEMWENPATVANVSLLKSRGFHFVGPASGMLTGTDVGVGRMSEPEDIVRHTLSVATNRGLATGLGGATDHKTVTDPNTAVNHNSRLLAQNTPSSLSGRHVVISAGGTREPLDPVRFLANRSSGKQGFALAQAALQRGARVTLVAAQVDAEVEAGIAASAARFSETSPTPDASLMSSDTGRGKGQFTVVRVTTATELLEQMTASSRTADTVIMAAAVADYRPQTVSESKIKKENTGDTLTLTLVKNPDILATLAEHKRPEQTIVGFAAETAANREELLALGRAKAQRKGADFLVLNAVSWEEGFGSPNNTIVIIRGSGEIVSDASGTKQEVAGTILDALG
ncbi:bifunctional phosphopantothenoylcysteine decarboxylase/phosphopantothenate synthase [Lysinibacter sp. HNR]|uniref:bifunctional phosphopantothenoylcysteine decarboxylase/phosphopantothenate synthase n=1 Tax=Lysinibacter sp. HNR TaxID=3031408 RepID=UPI0024354592|nr:bifunctional phosphopantothenoylcysteine decarboxylase/phosphopantothenate synthase [Lysinibacter sp. HNR]WGD37409.1 bifunctional phosphopantothenoylcysteine decarboxylase/phosphopantothenate synthase [Lysinibacter sp. HNR]